LNFKHNILTFINHWKRSTCLPPTPTHCLTLCYLKLWQTKRSGTKLRQVGCYMLLKFRSQVTLMLICISNILVTA